MPGGSAYKFLPSSGSQYQGGALPANTLVMLNSSGSTVAKYSVVIADTAITDNQAFTTSTAQDDHKVIGITLEAIPNGARGLVQTQGVVEKCRVAAGTDRYEYLRQSTTAGVADPTAAPTSGTFGRALTSRDADGYARVQIMHMHTGLGPDTTAPTLGLALCNGNSLRLFFDEALDAGSVPAVTAFAVVVAGGADVVTAVAVNGSVVRLTLTTAATNGQAVTVAYTKPGAGMLQDLAGNDVATFGATAAVNDTPAAIPTDTTAPRISYAYVKDTTLTLVYDEQLDTGSVPATAAYSIVVDGAGGVNPSAVAIAGATVKLTMTAPTEIAVISVSYTAGANPVRDLAATPNNAANLVAQSVQNLQGDYIAPTVGHRRVNRDILVILYNEPLSNTTPATTDFAVVVAGSSRAVNTVQVAGNIVTLTLASRVSIDQAVTVAYTQPGVNAIADLANNKAASYTAESVLNTTTSTEYGIYGTSKYGIDARFAA